jgi:hypothetical protein
MGSLHRAKACDLYPETMRPATVTEARIGSPPSALQWPTVRVAYVEPIVTPTTYPISVNRTMCHFRWSRIMSAGSGRTLEEVLAWCLVRLMFPELGSRPFVA